MLTVECELDCVQFCCEINIPYMILCTSVYVCKSVCACMGRGGRGLVCECVREREREIQIDRQVKRERQQCECQFIKYLFSGPQTMYMFPFLFIRKTEG